MRGKPWRREELALLSINFKAPADVVYRALMRQGYKRTTDEITKKLSELRASSIANGAMLADMPWALTSTMPETCVAGVDDHMKLCVLDDVLPQSGFVVEHWHSNTWPVRCDLYFPCDTESVASAPANEVWSSPLRFGLECGTYQLLRAILQPT